MSAQGIFRFGTYTMRPAGKGDMALAVEWTAADADHAGRTRPEFWLEQGMGIDSYLLEDEEGPIVFFKLYRLSMRALEMHTQFAPTDQNAHTRRRTIEAIMNGFGWFQDQAEKIRVTELHFDSTCQSLRNFAVRRLGFSISQGSRLSKVIGGV